MALVLGLTAPISTPRQFRRLALTTMEAHVAEPARGAGRTVRGRRLFMSRRPWSGLVGWSRLPGRHRQWHRARRNPISPVLMQADEAEDMIGATCRAQASADRCRERVPCSCEISEHCISASRAGGPRFNMRWKQPR
jgi:hypothetical protein